MCFQESVYALFLYIHIYLHLRKLNKFFLLSYIYTSKHTHPLHLLHFFTHTYTHTNIHTAIQSFRQKTTGVICWSDESMA